MWGYWKVLDVKHGKFGITQNIVSDVRFTLDGWTIKECMFGQLVSLYIKNKYLGKIIGVKGFANILSFFKTEQAQHIAEVG